MDVRQSPQTILDYCTDWRRKEIRVNRAYQRSDRVWPEAARSYLIESIILQFPIPKLSLHQLVEAKTKLPYKEIVDGQQRTMAIVDFFDDKYPLSMSLETNRLRGRSFSELEGDDEDAFLNYSLDIDLFVATTAAEVREAFRRMNSYTIPLNKEEQRHAHWQGEFKWFVNSLGHALSDTLISVGALSEKQVIRMQDTKLFGEVCHSALKGIQTIKDPQVSSLYKEFDRSFPQKDWLGPAIIEAMNEVAGWVDLHRGPLMKTYNLYALILALIHTQDPLGPLQSDFPLTKRRRISDDIAVANLSALAAAQDDPEAHPEFADFVAATKSKTNVRDQRAARFFWMCTALSQKSL